MRNEKKELVKVQVPESIRRYAMLEDIKKILNGVNRFKIIQQVIGVEDFFVDIL